MEPDQGGHVVVVEAYQGRLEFLSDEREELEAHQGIGLPIDELAERLGCRMTVLAWDGWRSYEGSRGSAFARVLSPATRPTGEIPVGPTDSVFRSERVRRIPVPAKDPVFGRPFTETGLSLQSQGLIANNDWMFFASFCLREELILLHRRDPIDALVFPMWGGLGYIFQIARATGAEPRLDVPCVVAVTDTSARRHRANQEGDWSLEGTIRRQMEDLSLALADAVWTFGPRGAAIADRGRPSGSPHPVTVPRRVPSGMLDRISDAADRSPARGDIPAFFLYEPHDGASGMLTALDAVALLGRRGDRLRRPMVGSGPSMIFAPAAPRSFSDFWSSRGFVRELVRNQQWQWEGRYPSRSDGRPIRVYPGVFDHLPNVWTELARGNLVLLSPAAAEGLAPGAKLPPELVMAEEPCDEVLADALGRLNGADGGALEDYRRKLCEAVVESHRGGPADHLMRDMVNSLDGILRDKPPHRDLSVAARMLLDRRKPLSEAASDPIPPGEGQKTGSRRGGLSVVVPCYELGGYVRETVESVWASTRVPDEVLLIDDGSQDEETRRTLEGLETEASNRELPLTVIRQPNRGLSGARNAGLEKAAGEYISFLDGDDLIDRRFYRLASDLLDRYPGLGGVGSWVHIFNGSRVTGFWNGPQPELPSEFVDHAVCVPFMMRTETLRVLSGYDTGQRYNYEDWELAVRYLVSGYPIVTIPMYLLKYRDFHGRSGSMYATLTDVQHQVMRERLFDSHREAVREFGVEIAMRLENKLNRRNRSARKMRRGGGASLLGLAAGLWRAAKRFVYGLGIRGGVRIRPNGNVKRP